MSPAAAGTGGAGEACGLANRVLPGVNLRPFSDIRRPDRVATKPSLGPMHGYPKGSLADAAGVPALVDIGRCANDLRIHERDHQRIENTVSATRGQPLAARGLARKDELEDALVDLRRGDAATRSSARRPSTR